jgi:hypothetical protein
MPVLAPDPPDDDVPPATPVRRDPGDDHPLLTPRHVDNLVEALGNMSRHTAILVDVQRRIAADGKSSRIGVEKLNDSTQELSGVAKDLSGAIRDLAKIVPTLVASNKDLIESNARLMRVLKGERTGGEDTTPSGRRKRG